MTIETLPVKLSDFLTVADAAEVLGVSPSTLRHWDRTDKLKCVRHPVNGYRLYRRTDLETLLAGLNGGGTDGAGAGNRGKRVAN
jgi:MerR family transcriptional regulator, copper efflux regulator